MARRRRRKFHFEELEPPLERPDPTAEAAHEEAEKTAAPRAEHANGSPHDRVLELQKTAGNRAVGAALGRAPQVEAEPKGQARWPKDKQVIFDGQAIPLESFSQGITSSIAAPGAGTAKPRADEFTGPGEMVITIPDGLWSADLLSKSSEGQGYKTVEIILPTRDGKGLRIILTDVALAGYASAGGSQHPVSQLTLAFKARTFTQDPPPG